jgi:DNA-3-methyladenine glycosylase II
MAHFIGEGDKLHKITIKPKAPYDLHKMIKRVQGVNHELYRFDGGHLLRTVRVAGKSYLIEISQNGEPNEPTLELIIHNAGAGEDVSDVVRHLESMFSMEVELLPFYNKFKEDDVIGSLIKRFWGLRFILEADPFECMIKTIIGQQLNLSFASTLNKRLIEYTTEPFVFKDMTIPVFPSAEQVAVLTPEPLRNMQFSQRKAEYVIDFAKNVVNGTVDFESLQDKEDEYIIESLTKLRGIGRWTVECFLLFGLGRTNLLPAADIGLRNAMKQCYGLAAKPTEQEVRAIGEIWSPWRSYVTFYLWESLHRE